MLLIGIDEAGYGPRIGPLCLGYSAIRCREFAPGEPPDLWKLLHPSVMRVPAFDGSTVVDATAASDMGIDVVGSEYATIAAERSALERLAEDIAVQIVARVAVYARNQAATAAPVPQR